MALRSLILNKMTVKKLDKLIEEIAEVANLPRKTREGEKRGYTYFVKKVKEVRYYLLKNYRSLSQEDRKDYPEMLRLAEGLLFSSFEIARCERVDKELKNLRHGRDPFYKPRNRQKRD